MMVKNKTNKNYKRSQKGRSMVEMLGVLAIVGVLSVGGVYGYGVAMKKHKANEALHKASLLATTVSAYAMSNDGNLPSTITDFANLGYDTELTDDGTQFKLTMKGVGYDVCKQMESSMGGVVRKVTCIEGSDDAIITYYKNLATNDEEGKNSPTGGNSTSSFNPNGPTKDDDGAVCSGDRPGECSVCLSTGESTAHWFDSDALCTEPGQTCVDGTCVTSAEEEFNLTGPWCICENDGYCGGREYGLDVLCLSDADCAQYGAMTWLEYVGAEVCVIEKYCTNNSDCTSDEYCHYNSVDYNTCKPDKKGTCVKKANAKGDFASGTTAEADGFIRSRADMDWFTAQNFCRSYGKNLVTLSQMGLGSAVPSGKDYCFGFTGSDACQITADEWSAIQEKFGTDFYPWTANLVPSTSCKAFGVALHNNGDAFVYDGARYYNQGYGSALCK